MSVLYLQLLRLISNDRRVALTSTFPVLYLLLVPTLPSSSPSVRSSSSSKLPSPTDNSSFGLAKSYSLCNSYEIATIADKKLQQTTTKVMCSDCTSRMRLFLSDRPSISFSGHAYSGRASCSTNKWRTI